MESPPPKDSPLRLKLKSALKTGLLWWPQSGAATTHTRILTYHSVGTRKHAMTVHPDAFAEQMAWLAASYPVIPLAEAAKGVPGVALTFDDGFYDNLEFALPILQQHHLPATLFMVAGHLGGFLPGDPEIAENRLLAAEDLRCLDREGIEIGAHTLHHARLADLPPQEQATEIRESKHTLEAGLGHPINAFAYPFGSHLDYTQESVRLVQEAGFDYAVSNRYGVVHKQDAPFALRRIWIDAHDTPAYFKAKVEGKLDALRHLDSPAGIRLRRLLNRGLR